MIHLEWPEPVIVPRISHTARGRPGVIPLAPAGAAHRPMAAAAPAAATAVRIVVALMRAVNTESPYSGRGASASAMFLTGMSLLSPVLARTRTADRPQPPTRGVVCQPHAAGVQTACKACGGYAEAIFRGRGGTDGFTDLPAMTL